MIRAIAIKELRETIGLAALALVALAYYVHNLIDKAGGERVPFVLDDYFPMLALVQWLLAIGLGLRQSAWERIRGTYPFLLHRPASPTAIFVAKFATGLVQVQAVAAVPIVWYGVWASTPNTHPSPFEWSMTESAWSVWLSLPVAYLSAFLSGLRPARWWGTRLLPGVAGSMLFLFISMAIQSWPITLAASLALSAILMSLIFYVAKTSDFG